jgi:Fe-S cluster biosynthesis and repair protein YggX
MNNRKHIQEELENLKSNLPYHLEKPVFTVPESYFDNFAASVFAKINEGVAVSVTDELNELSPLLASIKKKMPYEVPENYFLKLHDEVPLLIHDDEVPSFLADKKSMPYKVPLGYFSDLPNSMLGKITRPTAKVVSIKRNSWMKMAVAVMVAGIIAVSGIFYFNEKPSTIDPAKYPGQWVAKNLEGVSNQALDEFIKTADLNASEKAVKTSTNVEVRKMLNEVTDTELDAFLAAVPDDDEALFIIN